MFVLTGHNDEYSGYPGRVRVRAPCRPCGGYGLPAPASAVALSITAGRGE
jgi:hypothetical protein